jgi:hypothetical protein
MIDLGISGQELRDFLSKSFIDPRSQAFLAAEAVASHFGLPIHAAQQIIRDL